MKSPEGGTIKQLLIIALLTAFPLIKHGQCPSGYCDSGSYCVPMSKDTPVAVPKAGSCPSGFVQSGNYCLEKKR